MMKYNSLKLFGVLLKLLNVRPKCFEKLYNCCKDVNYSDLKLFVVLPVY